MKEFNCWSCGACCKIVGLAVENAKEKVSTDIHNATPMEIESSMFPYRYDLSGRCSKLNVDNKCEVYDNRPRICKVSESYNIHYKHILTWEEYCEVSEELCKGMEQIMEGF